MEFRFDVIVYSKLGDEDSNAGNIKCSLGPQVPHPWSIKSRRLPGDQRFL